MSVLNLDQMATSRLADLYNEWATKPVAKFASKTAAVSFLSTTS